MILFDEKGRRALKLTQLDAGGAVLRGWQKLGKTMSGGPLREIQCTHVWGFEPHCWWRPAYIAHRMSKGYRIQELDVGMCDYVDVNQVSDWWKSAEYGCRKFPTVMAVEAYLRTKHAYD